MQYRDVCSRLSSNYVAVIGRSEMILIEKLTNFFKVGRGGS